MRVLCECGRTGRWCDFRLGRAVVRAFNSSSQFLSPVKLSTTSVPAMCAEDYETR